MTMLASTKEPFGSMFQRMQHGQIAKNMFFALICTLFIFFHVAVSVVYVLELSK